MRVNFSSEKATKSVPKPQQKFRQDLFFGAGYSACIKKALVGIILREVQFLFSDSDQGMRYGQVNVINSNGNVKTGYIIDALHRYSRVFLLFKSLICSSNRYARICVHQTPFFKLTRILITSSQLNNTLCLLFYSFFIHNRSR